MNFSNKYLQFVIGYIAFSFSILEGLSFLIDNYQFNSKILDYTLLVLVIGNKDLNPPSLFPEKFNAPSFIMI